MLSKSLDPRAMLTMVAGLVAQSRRKTEVSLPPPSPKRAKTASAEPPKPHQPPERQPPERQPPERQPEPQPRPLAKRDTLPSLPAAALASPLAPLITEALELVAAPDIRSAVIAAALARAGLDVVPSDITVFAQFVSESLHPVVRERLGEEAAEAVLEDLETISGIHRREMMMTDQKSGVRAPMVSKIVLADDDAQLLSVLARALREAGYEVLTTDNGRDALSLALRNAPQVVVIDMHIPVLNGKDVCQLLYRMRGKSAPATVLITADIAVPRDLALISSVLYKPLKVKALITAIEEAAQIKLADAL
jgi:CheY-like chemotaxis protein